MSKNTGLLIFGAGQYGSVVKEIAESMGCFDKICFLDDSFGENNYHEAVIGKMTDIGSFCGEYTHAIVAIGNPEVRLALVDKIKSETTLQIPVLISPKAYVSPSASLGQGTVVEPLAGVHANTVIGEATYVSMGAVVNHNAVVGDGCHIDNNAVVMQGAIVPSKTKVPPCTVVRRSGTPVLDKNAEWVKKYIEENGHEPSFF